MAADILNVVLWSNGMVMVFDKEGEQLPHLQGRLDKVRVPVLSATTKDACFFRGVWPQGRIQITRGDFANEPWDKYARLYPAAKEE